MKIERISENQIKFLLSNKDLEEREIKLSELAQGSEKAQSFFRDIMTEAMLDCGFDASNTPLMIEAMPVNIDMVMIIVSKVTKEVDINRTVSLVPKSIEERKFKQSSIKIDEEIDNPKEIKEENDIYIYSFKNLDDITNLSLRMSDLYKGENVLYKYKDKFFLSIEKDDLQTQDLDSIILEYGQKHISNLISKYYLQEHAEIIIKKDALNILASLG